MSEHREQIYGTSVESVEIDPEMDLPDVIGDEWADPEELLNDFCSDNIEAEMETIKRFKSNFF